MKLCDQLYVQRGMIKMRQMAIFKCGCVKEFYGVKAIKDIVHFNCFDCELKEQIVARNIRSWE